MRNKVKITKTTFHVDRENKVVVCKLECDMQLSEVVGIDTDIRRKFPNVNWAGEFSVKAKSKCDRVDTFDELKGKRIAEGRAKIKMFSIAERVWEELAKKACKLVNECSNRSKACEEAKEAEENHIRELIIL